MIIRRACAKDLEGVNGLLRQVLMVHHNGRPDLFKGNVKKYNDDELLEIFLDDNRPVFVAVENHQVLGYAFCIKQQYLEHNVLTDILTLYIDDICVDENVRGQHIGKQIYEYVIDYARKEHFYNVTLNVWSCNPGAMEFYKQMGLTPYKIGMEQVLD